MKLKILLIIYFIFTLLLAGYFILPNNSFPTPPVDAVRSTEPADSETPLRRAYFTNYTREQIIDHYRAQFAGPITLRLNYPPEEAGTIIRDQTRSYYLEELAQPLRESLYVNGFVPTKAKDDIWYKGQHFAQKITIKHVSSSVFVRIILLFVIYIVGSLIILEWYLLMDEIVKTVKKE